jgi:tetratricopeptide (TPR) repeat protein
MVFVLPDSLRPYFLVFIAGVALLLPSTCANGADGSVTADSEPAELNKIEQLARYSENPRQALPSLEAILAKEARNSRAHFLLGLVLERSGFADLASQEYDRALELDPNSALKIFVSKWENSGPLSAAAYQKYVRDRYPHDPSLLLMQAYQDSKRGSEAGAERCYLEAMSRHAGVLGVATAFSAFRLSQRRFEEALRLADCDLNLKKDFLPAALVKGEALLQERKYLAALPIIQKAYDAERDGNGSESRKAAELLCRLYQCQGLYKAALEPALVGLALSPQAQVPAAAASTARSLKYCPDSFVSETVQSLLNRYNDPELSNRFLLRLAQVAGRNDRTCLCQQFWSQAAKIKPAALPYFSLACIKERQGAYAEAEKLLQAACHYAPQEKPVSTAYRRLSLRLNNRHRDLAWKLKDLLKL